MTDAAFLLAGSVLIAGASLDTAMADVTRAMRIARKRKEIALFMEHTKTLIAAGGRGVNERRRELKEATTALLILEKQR